MYNQEFLDNISQNDACEFLKDVSNWNNHRPLLLLALELTKEGLVSELGCGDGSTNHLSCYCEKNNRKLISFDNNPEWINKFKYLESANHTFETSDVPKIYDNISVALVDHAPGEQRWIDIQNLQDKADIIVIHDSEPEATGYMLNKIWHLFKYRINYKTNGAWATMISNKYDLHQFDGLFLDKFKLEV